MLVTYTTSIKIEALQFLYFLLCGCALLLGVGWFIASVNVFYRDVGHGVSVFVNLLFWLTPIVWYKEMIPEKFHFIAEYNPIHYVIEGYRSSFVLSEVILPTFQSTACFWSVTITFLIIGNLTFKSFSQSFRMLSKLPVDTDVCVSVKNVSKKFLLHQSAKSRFKSALLNSVGSGSREFWALNNVTFDIFRGEIVGILGRNGSGKSTLLQVICSIMKATSGSVEVQGRIASLPELEQVLTLN